MANEPFAKWEKIYEELGNQAVTNHKAGCTCGTLPIGTSCEWLAAPEPEPAPIPGPLTLEKIKAEFAKDGRLTKKQIQWLIDRVDKLGAQLAEAVKEIDNQLKLRGIEEVNAYVDADDTE